MMTCYNCGGTTDDHDPACPAVKNRTSPAMNTDSPTAEPPIGAHHLTPASIVALVADLEACESGGEFPAIQDRDWRTRCGVIARVIRHLAECAVPVGQGSAPHSTDCRNPGCTGCIDPDALAAELGSAMVPSSMRVPSEGSATSSEAERHAINKLKLRVAALEDEVWSDEQTIINLRAALAASAEQPNSAVLSDKQTQALTLAAATFDAFDIAGADDLRSIIKSATVSERAAAPDADAQPLSDQRGPFATWAYRTHTANVRTKDNGEFSDWITAMMFDAWNESRRLALAERAAAPASVPEGYKLVPVEPTKEMARAGRSAWACTAGLDMEAICKAMISAAPEVAQPAAQGERAAPSESIVDDHEFMKLRNSYVTSLDPRPVTASRDQERCAVAWRTFVAYINAWGASQRQEGRREGIEEAAAMYDTSPHAEEFRVNIAESIRALKSLATPAPTAGEPSAIDPIAETLMRAGHTRSEAIEKAAEGRRRAQQDEAAESIAQPDELCNSALRAEPAGQHDAAIAVLSAVRDGIPLQEPVNITKAVLAQREARVSLSGGTGPVACAMLVNIQLTGWAEGPETAKAFASGYNTAIKWFRASLLDLADKVSAAAATRSRAEVGITCPKCGVDRIASPCPTPSDCGMIGTAHIKATQGGKEGA